MHDANRDPGAAAIATGTPGHASACRTGRDPDQGHIVWHSLRSSDPVRARDFYARLLGWAVQPVWAHPADRALLQLGGSAVAALEPLDPADGDDSHWLPMIATADVEGCCARASELRGSVYPSVDGRRGMAVLEDPQGAVWAALGVGAAATGPRPAWHHRPASHQPTIYRPGAYRTPGYRPVGYPGVGSRQASVRETGPGHQTPGHQTPGHQMPGHQTRHEERGAHSVAVGRYPDRALPPLPPPPPPGSVAHTILITPDPRDAREFYGSLLGWRFHDTGRRPAEGDLLGAVWIARTGACEQATIVASTPAVRARLPRPAWLPCVTVASLDGSLEAAWAMGASVILGGSLLPTLGRLGVVRDPAGGVLALVEAVGAGSPGHPAGRR